MKISVIVPVYNSEDYLATCVESILSQTYEELEIILINDGSTDNSGTICDNFAKRDSRVKVFHQENKGVSNARNRGLDIASGEFITFVDSDDTLECDMYETLINLALKYKADVAHCGYRKMFFDGTSKAVLGTGVLLLQDGIEISKCILKGEYFTGSLCTKLYRRELFNDLRFQTNLKINEDLLINIQIFRKNTVGVFWDMPKYYYYERAKSATRMTKLLKCKEDCVEAAERMLTELKGSDAESACAERLYYALIDFYRANLLHNTRNNELLMNIHKRVREITGVCGRISVRNLCNYCFMRWFPGLYVWIYHIYDNIRKPNVDL